jgi:hypothetical protein
LVARRRRNKAWANSRRRRKTALNTRQWLVLTAGIATVVGLIFILALYYQPGR